MKVHDIMTREVISVRENTSVNEVAKLMHRHAISGVPVLDAAGRLVGLITERDLMQRNARLEIPAFVQIFDANIPLELPRHLSDRLRHVLGTRAADVMTRDLRTVTPDTEVEDVVRIMVGSGANPVPVVEAGALVGIVSRADIIKMMAAELGES